MDQDAKLLYAMANEDTDQKKSGLIDGFAVWIKNYIQTHLEYADVYYSEQNIMLREFIQRIIRDKKYEILFTISKYYCDPYYVIEQCGTSLNRYSNIPIFIIDICLAELLLIDQYDIFSELLELRLEYDFEISSDLHYCWIYSIQNKLDNYFDILIEYFCKYHHGKWFDGLATDVIKTSDIYDSKIKHILIREWKNDSFWGAVYEDVECEKNMEYINGLCVLQKYHLYDQQCKEIVGSINLDYLTKYPRQIETILKYSNTEIAIDMLASISKIGNNDIRINSRLMLAILMNNNTAIVSIVDKYINIFRVNWIRVLERYNASRSSTSDIIFSKIYLNDYTYYPDRYLAPNMIYIIIDNIMWTNFGIDFENYDKSNDPGSHIWNIIRNIIQLCERVLLDNEYDVETSIQIINYIAHKFSKINFSKFSCEFIVTKYYKCDVLFSAIEKFKYFPIWSLYFDEDDLIYLFAKNSKDIDRFSNILSINGKQVHSVIAENEQKKKIANMILTNIIGVSVLCNIICDYIG